VALDAQARKKAIQDIQAQVTAADDDTLKLAQ
jgi:hypothetical protein